MSPEEAREHATAILIDHAPSYTGGDVEIVATAIFLDDFPDARVAGNKSVDGLMDEYRQNARAALDALAAAGRLAKAAS